MAFGIDLTPVLAALTASVEATSRLAAAIERQAEAQERANKLHNSSVIDARRAV